MKAKSKPNGILYYLYIVLNILIWYMVLELDICNILKAVLTATTIKIKQNHTQQHKKSNISLFFLFLSYSVYWYLTTYIFLYLCIVASRQKTEGKSLMKNLNIMCWIKGFFYLFSFSTCIRRSRYLWNFSMNNKQMLDIKEFASIWFFFSRIKFQITNNL